MSFKLAEAFVELKSKGFKTVSSELAKTRSEMESATGSAGSLTDSVRGAGKEMLEAAGASDALGDGMKTVTDSAGSVLDAFDAFKNLELKNVANEAEELAEGLGDAAEGAGDLGGKLGKSGGKIASMVGKAGRLLGIIGLVGTAAKGVYDAVRKWSWDEYRKESEKALQLTKQLGDVRQGIAQRAIDSASRLANIDAQRLAIQELMLEANKENNENVEALKNAKAGADVGFFSSFVDGKWTEELEEELKIAQEEADQTTAALGKMKDELASIDKVKLDKASVLAERLKEETMLVEKGAQALREYQLSKDGFTGDEAAKIAGKEFDLASAAEEKQHQQDVSDAYDGQIDQLRLKNLELEKGAEAAAREADRMAGFSEPQLEQLSLAREKARLAEQSKADDEKAKADAQAIVDVYTSQVQELELKALAIKEGTAAAQVERDIASGLSKDQAEILASKREQNRLDEEKKTKDQEAKDNTKELETSFDKQIEQLRLKNLEIEKGAEAAQQERDRMAGYTAEQVKQLSNQRKENGEAKAKNVAEEKAEKDKEKAAEKAKKEADKALKASEEKAKVEEKARNASIVSVGSLADKSQTDQFGKQEKKTVGDFIKIPKQQHNPAFGGGARGLAGGGGIAGAVNAAGNAAQGAIDRKAELAALNTTAASVQTLANAHSGSGLKIASTPSTVTIPDASLKFGGTG